MFSCLFSTDGSLFKDYESRMGKDGLWGINLFAIHLVRCLNGCSFLESVFTVNVAAQRTLYMSHGPFPHLSLLLPCGFEMQTDLSLSPSCFFPLLCHPCFLQRHASITACLESSISFCVPWALCYHRASPHLSLSLSLSLSLALCPLFNHHLIPQSSCL